jgi:LmbE family N-acetylglucosaminyl deacetylase
MYPLFELSAGQVKDQEITVERTSSGKPHTGKVFAAVQAHADDIPFFCAGTMAKLIEEGYTGYIIQTTNDDKCGPTPSLGETVLSNEREVEILASALGIKQVFNLGYRNHFLDGESALELRCRLVLLFRALKVDTVLTFNPWGTGERNPDHWMTGRAVESSYWMAGMNKDYPEHFAAGLEPHAPRECYYWVGRHGQPFNRVVDIGPYMEAKVAAMSANKSQGPAGSSGSQLRARLAAKGLRLPELDGDDETADREYIRRFLLEPYSDLGRRHGLEYAEPFFYVGRERSSMIDDYIAQHAVPLR